jgi:hypothetical protein
MYSIITYELPKRLEVVAALQNRDGLYLRKPNAEVSGAGAPKVRRAPTWAMRMPKAWPMLASA